MFELKKKIWDESIREHKKKKKVLRIIFLLHRLSNINVYRKNLAGEKE